MPVRVGPLLARAPEGALRQAVLLAPTTRFACGLLAAGTRNGVLRLAALAALALAPAAAAPTATAQADDSEFDDSFGAVTPAPIAPTPAPEATLAANEPAAPAADVPSVAAIQNTFEGLTGGIHAVDAASGKSPSARVSMGLDLFQRRGFLVDGAMHRHGGAHLNASVSLFDHVELAIATSARGDENEASSPRLIQTIGDTHLFAKGYMRPTPWLAVGGDMEVALLNTLGGVGFQTNAAGVALRGNATFDLRKIDRALPLIVRTSLRYAFDNSARLVRNIERYRYAALPDAAAQPNEYRNLITGTERYAYGVNRLDQLGLSFGFEVPLQPRPKLHVHPLLEWNVQLPVNRQGFDCVVTQSPSDHDGCLASSGFSARSSTLSMGVRVEPKVPGLGLLFGIDVATSGAHTLVRDIAPNAPYAILLQAAYAIQPRETLPAVRIVERVEVPVDLRRGHIQGSVVDDTTGAPVDHAFVDFDGHDLTTQATNAQGRFTSYGLLPGRHVLRIQHPGYEDGVCVGELRDNFDDVDVRCSLIPKLAVGHVMGTVQSLTGAAVASAQVELTGPKTVTLSVDGTGGFDTSELVPGSYALRVTADGFLAYAGNVQVQAGDTRLALTLTPRPASAHAVLTAKRIQLKRSVQFVPNSAQLTNDGHTLLLEVADVLLAHPEVQQVEVQGHTDNSGSAVRNLELSQARAEAVVSNLVSAGVPAHRLEAKGYGDARPIAPNITPTNRARNRRVEFVIAGAE